MSDTTIADRPPHTRAEIQAWLDTLGPRESEMLADLVGEKEYRATIHIVGVAANAVASVARKHADNGDPKASRVVREVVDLLLAVQRDMIAQGASLASSSSGGSVQ